MLKVNVLFQGTAISSPPTQVIMTSNSLPENLKQIDVGGFAFAVSGTLQSQPCTEKVLSTCLMLLLIPSLQGFISFFHSPNFLIKQVWSALHPLYILISWTLSPVGSC